MQAVVFDLYGTLLAIAQPRRPYRQLLNLLQQKGRPPHPTDAARVMTVDAGLAGIAGVLGAALDPADVAPLERELFAELSSVRVFEDAVPTLESLRERGLRLALCSNLASPYAVPAHLLLPPMDAYGFSFAVGAVKPQAQIYQAVCAALKLQPSAVLMVGDTFEADVAGPLAVGMQSCHLVRDGSASSPAHHSIRSLGELLQVL